MCLAIILSLHQAKLCKVADDDVGAAFPEDLRIVAPGHADDEAEAASLARLDPGDGVLYHDAPFRRRPEHPGGLLVGLGGRLAHELLLRGDVASTLASKRSWMPAASSSVSQFLLDVTTAARLPVDFSSRIRATEDPDTSTPQNLVEHRVLTVLESADGLPGGRSLGFPHQRTMPRERRKLSMPS